MNAVKLFPFTGGELRIGGKSIRQIALRAGTPFYIYDAAILRRQYQRLAAALPENTFVHYSVKANPNINVARVFGKLGAGAEVASEGELAMALKAGFAPEKIIFAGPGKSEADIRMAVAKKIGCINVESAAELGRIITAASETKSARPVKIAFRVNLTFTGGAGEVMTGGPRKFGTDDTELPRLIKKALAEKRVEVMGFHCFAGTQITDTDTLGAMYRGFAQWAATTAAKLGMTVKTLNFGGGLGIPFGEKDRELDVKKLGAVIRDVRREILSTPNFAQTRLLLEPGRYLAGPAGIYVSRVTDVKTSRGRLYAITDGGIHHAIVPIALNKNYPAAILTKTKGRKVVECTVAGPLCASADQFSRIIKLSSPRIGDLLGIFNSGAYGYTAGMLYFLSHPLPAEVMADGARLFLIRKTARPDHGAASPERI
ncbi:MAG: diaminopimelate decarboxylase [Nitrospinae bacterium]|nr:diaminopimelate decarboxylase [Nitrospinota bacterium]